MPNLINTMKMHMDFLKNPYAGIVGLSVQSVIALVGATFTIACLCWSVYWYQHSRSGYMADVSRLTLMTERLRRGKFDTLKHQENFLADLPREVVSEELVGEVYNFSKENHLNLDEVAIQSDPLTAGKLGQIHYIMTLHGQYADIKKLLIGSLTRHAGLVVDKLVIKKGPLGQQGQVFMRRRDVEGFRPSGAKDGISPLSGDAPPGGQEADVVLTQWFKP